MRGNAPLKQSNEGAVQKILVGVSSLPPDKGSNASDERAFAEAIDEKHRFAKPPSSVGFDPDKGG